MYLRHYTSKMHHFWAHFMTRSVPMSLSMGRNEYICLNDYFTPLKGTKNDDPCMSPFQLFANCLPTDSCNLLQLMRSLVLYKAPKLAKHFRQTQIIWSYIKSVIVPQHISHNTVPLNTSNFMHINLTIASFSIRCGITEELSLEAYLCNMMQDKGTIQ